MAKCYFWREIGHRMNIRDIPAEYEIFDRFSRDYEQQHYCYSEANHRVGCGTRDMFLSWFPRPFHPFVRSAIYAMLDDELIAGFGFPKPSRFMRWLVPATLRLRAGAVRWLPERGTPCLRTAMKNRTYPAGYKIDELGPPENGR